jgi:ubiquinone/menaquinone biosynthesis C-methylase UbiE
LTVREVLKYYSDISKKYDRLRFGSEKGRIISDLQIEWFVRNLKNEGLCLEIGCGTGRVTRFLVKNVDSLICADASREMVEINRHKYASNNNVHYIICDAFHLPFREKTFSSVVGARVFWHLADFMNALRDASSVLKVGGVLLFDFPCLLGPFSLYSKLRRVKHDVLTLFTSRKAIKELFKSAYEVTFFNNTSVFLFFIPDRWLKYKMIGKLVQLFEKLNYGFFNDCVFSYYLIKVVKS